MARSPRKAVDHFNCGFCHESFTTKSRLQSHMDAEHLKDKPYRCSGCGKGYCRKINAEYHLRRHCFGSKIIKGANDELPATYPSITVGVPL